MESSPVDPASSALRLQMPVLLRIASRSGHYDDGDAPAEKLALRASTVEGNPRWKQMLSRAIMTQSLYQLAGEQTIGKLLFHRQDKFPLGSKFRHLGRLVGVQSFTLKSAAGPWQMGGWDLVQFSSSNFSSTLNPIP
ncbi:unnamed protein product [Symbiodinium microadriaticum]|nr:unnamed protein product [Symbiodinium microadriaticum]